MIETMQKRIEEIKQADRKAYYELANEIGISEYSLYSFMTRDECSANTENKINSYLRGYLTKDEKLEAYRMDNEELKAENDRLKAEIKEVKKYQYQQEYLDKEIAELKAYKDVNEDFKTAWDELKAENDSLKEENYQLQKDCQICENFIDFIPCKPIRDMDYDLQNVINQRDKYIQTLQEIKEIAKPFAKCYTHTCRNCEKYDSAHACCLKDINCYKYNDGSKSSCKDFVLPTKQFYQQILANVITQITKAEEE